MAGTQRRIYWGDLHNHNELGYGQGSMERSYNLARKSLDFYAFTPHGWWPDIPDTDESVKKRHLSGFTLVKKNWDYITETANSMNEEGKFVSFVAFEWHSLRWGDYCLYFPGNHGKLFYADNIGELQNFVLSQGAVMIPHHCAYLKGKRGTDWKAVNPLCSPVVEIFSEHGNSLENVSHMGLYGHSMGGSQSSQTIISQLCNLRLGFVAGTDNHFGYPGSFGEGLTAVICDHLAREDILNAVKKRHTYAVTGDRISLFFQAAGGMMGDILPADRPRDLKIEVDAPDSIDYIELVKNGRVFQKWLPGVPEKSRTCPLERRLRLEWGWGGMASGEKVRWDITLLLNNGEITETMPAFCGGPDLIGEQNYLEPRGEKSVKIISYTSRRNTYPTHSVVLKYIGTPETELKAELSGEWNGTRFSTEIVLNLKELGMDDKIIDIFPNFTSPQIKFHRILNPGELSFFKEWSDPEPGKNDFYYIKVLQKNGHMAWSSPVWFE